MPFAQTLVPAALDAAEGGCQVCFLPPSRAWHSAFPAAQQISHPMSEEERCSAKKAAMQAY